jgi:hypothetical protein
MTPPLIPSPAGWEGTAAEAAAGREGREPLGDPTALAGGGEPSESPALPGVPHWNATLFSFFFVAVPYLYTYII